MKLHFVEMIEPYAVKADVSEVARSSRGFLAAYKLASGEPAMLGRNPLTQKLWAEERTNFINRHYRQARQNRESFWDKTGNPSRRHLMLIMWAYTPTHEKTAAWLQRLRLRL
jgi:hypothetical protein